MFFPPMLGLSEGIRGTEGLMAFYISQVNKNILYEKVGGI